MSSDDAPSSKPPRLSPLEGGPWRPVQPEELLRRGPVEEPRPAEPPRVRVERQQELERYLQPKPSDVAAYLELADLYRKDNRPAEAVRTLKKGLEVDPDEPRLQWEYEEAMLAQSLFRLRQLRELSTRLQTAEAQHEYERAQVDWAARRVEVCRARRKRDPDNAHLSVLLAEALKDLGQYHEAMEAAERAIKDDHEAPTAYLIQGLCLQSQGKPVQALRAFRCAAMRRAVPAPAKIRYRAMREASTLAESLGLTETLPRYRRVCEVARRELEQAEAQPTAPSHADTKDIVLSNLAGRGPAAAP